MANITTLGGEVPHRQAADSRCFFKSRPIVTLLLLQPNEKSKLRDLIRLALRTDVPLAVGTGNWSYCFVQPCNKTCSLKTCSHSVGRHFDVGDRSWPDQ